MSTFENMGVLKKKKKNISEEEESGIQKKKLSQLISCLYTHLNCLNGNPEWFTRGVIL